MFVNNLSLKLNLMSEKQSRMSGIWNYVKQYVETRICSDIHNIESTVCMIIQDVK